MIWTRDLLDELKSALADRRRDEVIKFHGQDVLVSYGRYLAEYLETILR